MTKPVEVMQGQDPATAPPVMRGSSGWRPLLEGLRGDARFFVELRFPGQRPSWWTWARVLLGSHGLWVLATYRLDRGHMLWTPSRWPGRLLKQVVHVAIGLANRICQVLTKSDVVPSSGELEPRIYLSDLGHVKLGVRSAGAGTIIHDHVTIGRGRGGQDKPEIGRRVWIGPHCVIYGSFRIGDGATLLPHTVLTRAAPPGIVLQGNPATVVRRDFDNSALRRTLVSDDASLRAIMGPD